MAQQFSFDVVSQFNEQEVDNAVNQAKKEVEQRYDFKGTNTEIDLNLKEKTITLHTSDDMKLRALHEILNGKMIKRGISLKALDYGTAEQASGGTLRQVIKLKSGLESEQAKQITRMVKDLKLKVQAQIQGEEVRIIGKSKDDLQTAITALKGQNFDFPIQFTNYR
ncbi:MAG: YajQ family cyclic di-GMP-binding protein [Bacteroidota bacterium]|nr:YajQ family cyclic di-GMP-binding protein [Bacteroidota bacterium]MDP4229321.1 YajQ family cyclic di-GMP-binding protein [Bacteroidota bacterium]